MDPVELRVREVRRIAGRNEQHARDPALLQRLGVPEGRLVVVVLARLVAQKGHLRLLRALERIRSELPPMHLLVVGEGGMRDAIEQEIRKGQLQDIVTLTGHRADVPQILASSDLSVTLMASKVCMFWRQPTSPTKRALSRTRRWRPAVTVVLPAVQDSKAWLISVVSGSATTMRRSCGGWLAL